MANFLSKIFNEDARKIKQIEKRIQPVLDKEEEYKNKSDEELKAMTPALKERLANGETLDDIYVDAFATAREAARRVIGEFPYPVQLMGATVMQGGDIAEMKTGEGKTLTSVMAVYLNALEGKGVHVVTVNEYLSERDANWMGQIYRFLGLTVGVNLRQLTKFQKKQAYACDITYTTNSELGFDYLRDNMVTNINDRVLRGLNFALVDEVDSILIDESRTPLIISGGQKQTANLYLQADRFAKKLNKEEDYEIDARSKTVTLTETGVSKAERIFKVENLYDISHTQLLHHINQALKANFIMIRDIDYVVDDENDEIVIVDPNTGRLMKGRQWSGMTGTAKTEEEEFLEIYNMYVYEIPTNRPVARIDYPDAVYGTKKAKFKALVDEVVEKHATGQPILVGTIAVETSELISKYLTERKIPHNVLNAKNHAREAEIISHAGQKGAVTIATNMAGRGTDIKLGEGVRELGGLCVLGSERHESRRIDNQLRGRAGRQGDPGMSRFFVSVQDDLMIRFGSERMEGIFASLGDEAVESKTITKAISSAQRRVEGVNYDARKQLLQYDDVMRQQRETMYEQRDFILENDDVHEVVQQMFKRVISDRVSACTNFDTKSQDVDAEALIKGLNEIGFKDLVNVEELSGKNREDISSYVYEKAWEYYEQKVEPVKDKIRSVEKEVSLRTIEQPH